MATLVRKNSAKDSRWVIAWYDEFQKQKSISLNSRKYNQKTAERLKKVVEILKFNKANDIPLPGQNDQKWIIKAPLDLQKKLAKVGLIKLLEYHTCKELWETFMKWKAKSVSESTMKIYRQAEERFYTVFKEDELVESLKPEQFQELCDKLGETYAPTTIAGTFKQFHALFNWALKKKWVYIDPLEEIRRGSFINSDADQFVPTRIYDCLLEHCPNQEWRTILALARFGGMHPSEILTLRWKDVNWSDNHIVVRNPKTRQYEGKAKRYSPIYPEVRDELEKLFEQDENDGQGFVISRYHGNPDTNIRSTFYTIVQKAGLKKIPRPFDNMRMTRSNEIRAKFGEFCESMWIGHSRQVAMKHYFRILPEEIARAAQWVSHAEVINVDESKRRVKPKRKGTDL